jgi:hypothetical protein
MKRPEPAVLMILLVLSTLVISPLTAQASGTEARCVVVTVSGTDTMADVTVVALSADSNACALDGHQRVIARAREMVRAARTVAGAVGGAAATVAHVIVRTALRAAASAVAAVV